MQEKKYREHFEILSRMCLNNWHYIDRKILSFHKEINFFTGHSGSGKSTIIDALQVVLYANTDGRGFFNKAAADDSDRSLIEYLRGMVNMEENNTSQYLRNQDFSTTIVLEFTRSDTGEQQCVGVVFDVETAANDYSKRYFFWHQGGLFENSYRMEQRVMSAEEIREYLNRKYERGAWFATSRNETFRRKLYDEYLGGLDMEKFPMLFKRAIPFKMNSRIEEFVKEYICMEQDIHIEDMQESVIQYGRMQQKIMDIRKEVDSLKEIQESFAKVQQQKEEVLKYQYFAEKFSFLAKQQKIQELQDKVQFHREDLQQSRQKLAELEQKKQEYNSRKEELIRLISETGYQQAQDQLRNVNELLERLERSKLEWDETAKNLKGWADCEMAANTILWNVKKFSNYSIQEAEMEGLKEALYQLREQISEEKDDLQAQIKEERRALKETERELSELHKGSKVYPRELIEARQYLYQKLSEQNGKAVKVSILADLLDIKQERWRNAVEGYLGKNKLLLVVEPKYAKQATVLYQKMDHRKFFRVSVLDTEKVMERKHHVQEHALAEAVKTKEEYVRSFIDFLLGNVIKCENVEQMRQFPVAVTEDCMLYQGYRLQHINPDNYIKYAYIGTESLKRRMSMLKKKRDQLEKKLQPLWEELETFQQLLSMESLSRDASQYLEWLADIRRIPKQKKEKEHLSARILELQQKDVSRLKLQKEELDKELGEHEAQILHLSNQIYDRERQIDREEQEHLKFSQELVDQKRQFDAKPQLEQQWAAELQQSDQGPEYLQKRCLNREQSAQAHQEELFRMLAERRSAYLREHPNRNFGAFEETNHNYDSLLEELQCKDLERFQELAREQAKSALEHFKDDFIYKIRSAIEDAIRRKDELNKVIAKLDFGKDQYQFVFQRNSGEDGKYYDMFMDRDLDINPSQLSNQMENQMDLFRMEHENKYGEQMNELLNIFIPPVDASVEVQEEAKRSMDRYADYRTYLSFDMQQIIRGEDGQPMKLKLSKMLKKNSGGEGQNPLYVALLASFAQTYRISADTRTHHTPTIRLVVLDEAFSKMDAEKVASCISLIRRLGFQVIISATNDKIQNYLENVDKTFVFANPNKKSISIQEFEKREFRRLQVEE